jgi:hypothetical protein
MHGDILPSSAAHQKPVVTYDYIPPVLLGLGGAVLATTSPTACAARAIVLGWC